MKFNLKSISMNDNTECLICEQNSFLISYNYRTNDFSYVCINCSYDFTYYAFSDIRMIESIYFCIDDILFISIAYEDDTYQNATLQIYLKNEILDIKQSLMIIKKIISFDENGYVNLHKLQDKEVIDKLHNHLKTYQLFQ